jgi:hypothetical protein
MKHSSYFPYTIPNRRSWFANYKQKITLHGASLGMLPAEITAECDLCDAAIDAIDVADAAKATVRLKNKEQNDTIKASIGTLRKDIRQHKADNGYTGGIGADLGVIGPEIDIDILNVKTIVKAAKKFQGVDLKFTLQHCDGGNIYSKRKSDSDFRLLKYVARPHTVDTRANETPGEPEERQYLVVLVINDEEVGLPSDIVTIKV